MQVEQLIISDAFIEHIGYFGERWLHESDLIEFCKELSKTHDLVERDKQDNWISVDLLTPQDCTEVLACCDDDVELCDYDGIYYINCKTGKIFNAEYWMDKPDSYYQINYIEPPTQGEE